MNRSFAFLHARRVSFINIKYMPNEKSILDARAVDDPLLLLISHGGNTVIMGNIDVYGEHLILLKNAGWDEVDLDSFFRVVATSSGADWTFVVPENYKDIQGREERIKNFYDDGIFVITQVLTELQFKPEINIPSRYKRRNLDIINT